MLPDQCCPTDQAFSRAARPERLARVRAGRGDRGAEAPGHEAGRVGCYAELGCDIGGALSSAGRREVSMQLFRKQRKISQSILPLLATRLLAPQPPSRTTKRWCFARTACGGGRRFAQ